MKTKPTDFVAIGFCVYGKGETLYEALENARTEYGHKTARKDRTTFTAFHVTDDYKIDLSDGSVSATIVNRISRFDHNLAAMPEE